MNLVVITAVMILHIRCLICVKFNELSYSFEYGVEEPGHGVVTHHWEKRKGNQLQGGYSFLDANGKIRVVEYKVDGKKGFKAFVSFRKPPGQSMGHLHFPIQYRTPIRLVEPVGLITPDLFHVKEKYPNLPR